MSLKGSAHELIIAAASLSLDMDVLEDDEVEEIMRSTSFALTLGKALRGDHCGQRINAGEYEDEVNILDRLTVSNSLRVVQLCGSNFDLNSFIRGSRMSDAAVSRKENLLEMLNHVPSSHEPIMDSMISSSSNLQSSAFDISTVLSSSDSTTSERHDDDDDITENEMTLDSFQLNLGKHHHQQQQQQIGIDNMQLELQRAYDQCEQQQKTMAHLQQKLEQTFRRLIILTHLHTKKLDEEAVLLEENHAINAALQEERRIGIKLEEQLQTMRRQIQQNEINAQKQQSVLRTRIEKLQDELQNEKQVHMDLNAELNAEMDELRATLQQKSSDLDSKTRRLQQLSTVTTLIHRLTSEDCIPDGSLSIHSEEVDNIISRINNGTRK